MEIGEAFRSQHTDHGISDLEAIKLCAGACRCGKDRDRAGDGSPSKRGAEWRDALGSGTKRRRGEDCVADTRGSGVHRVFVGDGRYSEGLHDDTRELPRAVRRAHDVVSVLAGGEVPKHSADKSRHRFHGGIHWAVHMWGGRRAFADAEAGIRAGSLSEVSDHVCKSGAISVEESAEGTT